MEGVLDSAGSSALRDWATTWPLFAKTLFAGGVAGAVAKTGTAPLERAKIMMQTGQSFGVGGSLRRMWSEEGVRGLFRGNSAAVVRVTPYAALHLMALGAPADAKAETARSWDAVRGAVAEQYEQGGLEAYAAFVRGA